MSPDQPHRARRLARAADGGLTVTAARGAEGDVMERTVDGLHRAHPQLSARRTMTPRQSRGLVLVLVVLAALAVPFPHGFSLVVVAVLTVVYLASVVYRVLCTVLGQRHDHVIRVSDAEALAVSDLDLPHYTVMVAAYREPELIGTLIEHLEQLDYPRARLEVLLLLEADDDVTLAAARQAAAPWWLHVVVVPPSTMTTKPRALNYGLQLATGDLVAVYDVEDRPEPLQLRRAAVAFLRDPSLACVQARLDFFNQDRNRLTQWFTLDYVQWFTYMLPGLLAVGCPLPLGGTSNHLRADVLREVGAWDPYNVTEDADLGLRLVRLGHHLGLLDSVTYEEANSDVVNWVRQRSRWYKGYLQTWLVHMRHPRQLRREVGWKGVLGITLFIAGTPLLALFNPVFWTLSAVYLMASPGVIKSLFPAPVYYMAMVSFVFGNFAMLYSGLLTVRAAERPKLLRAALQVPAYWVLMSCAAFKGAWQLVRQPFYWEKTVHGLDEPVVEAAS